MIELKLIIAQNHKIKQKLKNRNFDVKIIDDLTELAHSRSKLMTNLQQLEAKKNKISKNIGFLKSQKKDVSKDLEVVLNIKEKIEDIKKMEQKVNKKINLMLLNIPNITTDDVPIGKNEIDNKVLATHIIGRKQVVNVKPHYEIGVEKDILDFENAVKISSSRFWSYKNMGAKLLRSLINFMLDTHIEKGYKEITPPLLVNYQAMQGTGQFPKFVNDAFKIQENNLYLIPTAEVPLTNFYSNQILNLDNPICLTSYTPCFRAEAGSGGKDTKGLIRSHNFNKVELVKIVKEANLEKEFNKTLIDAKSILEALQLSYREVLLCTGDTGFSSQKTIDLEVWIPSENRFREVSSVSSFGDFQARRSMIRYKDENNKNKYAFTINGSALAIDRIIAAILEIYQNDDGTIDIPKVLIPYLKKERI